MTPEERAGLRALPHLCFLDIEASGLDDGYPIEIAWVGNTGVGESHLIRPAAGWLSPDGRFQWSEAAEAVHGISWDTLLREGEPHDKVAGRVIAVLGRPGVVVASDAPEFDQHWLDLLLAAAGITQRIQVQLVDSMYHNAVLPLTRLLPPSAKPGGPEARQVIDVANRMLLAIDARYESQVRKHRALPDAMRMWRQWQAIRDEVARRVRDANR